LRGACRRQREKVRLENLVVMAQHRSLGGEKEGATSIAWLKEATSIGGPFEKRRLG